MPELFQKSTFFSEPPEIRIHEAEHDGRLGSHTHEFYELVYVVDGFTCDKRCVVVPDDAPGKIIRISAIILDKTS